MNRPFNVPIALPRGREHYWKVACQFGAKGFTLGQLAGCTNGVAVTTVAKWIEDMRRMGFIKQIGETKTPFGTRANVYAVAKKSAKAPVARDPDYQGLRGRMRQQMWTAMRVLPAFSQRELVVTASTDVVMVSDASAKAYCRHLVNAGVLQIVKPCERGGGAGSSAAVYRLKKSANSGPQAPRIFAAAIVFDPNRAEILGEAEVQS